MAASGILTFNGLDAYEDLDLRVTGVGGLLGSPSRTLGLLAIPSMAGVIDAGMTPTEDARVLTISALVYAASISALYTQLSEIKEVLGTGLVQIKANVATDRAYYGVLQSCEAAPHTQEFVSGWGAARLQFLCPIPYAIALSPTVVAFGSTKTDIPLGTAPSQLRDQWSAMLEVVGAATNPIVTYSDGAGVAVGTIASSYDPVAGDSIVYDLGRKTAYKFVTGVRTTTIATLTAGYTWPALDPGDGYAAGASYPKLSVDSGSGFLTYFKAYR